MIPERVNMVIVCWIVLSFVVFATPTIRSGDNPMPEMTEGFSHWHSTTPLNYRAEIPSMSFPLDKKDIGNWQELFEQKAPFLSPAAVSVLNKGSGAVAGQYDDFIEALESFQKKGIPVLITPDVFLHCFHLAFDEVLIRLEEHVLAGDLLRLLVGLESQLERVKPEPALRESYLMALQYVQLAACCLDPEHIIELPPILGKELELIDAHQGFQVSPLLDYYEDYSQYAPRGHYTRSLQLQRYFKAMMLMGRFTFILKGGEPHGQFEPYLVSAVTAKKQTLAAFILAQTLQNTKLPDGTDGLSLWAKIYNVSAFFSGFSDDLTPLDYCESLSTQHVKNLKELVESPSKYQAICFDIASKIQQQIYSGTGFSGTKDIKTILGKPAPEVLEEVLLKTSGMRLMGQRFTPDAYIMGKLVFPVVGGEPKKGRPFTAEMTGQGYRRVWPRGLDVMAVLGSKRADKWLEELNDSDYAGYPEARTQLEDEIGKWTEKDWYKSIYFGWLDVLKILSQKPGKGFQPFQLQDAWQDKTLNTSLASWTQLRHDTVLYSKQSYTMLAKTAFRSRPAQSSIYVEPLPELYNSLADLLKMTQAGLNQFNLSDQQTTGSLTEFETILRKITEVSILELQNRSLSSDDYQFLKSIPGRLKSALNNLSTGSGKSSPQDYRRGGESTIDPKTQLVTDVHTDSNTQQVLQEATGRTDIAVSCLLMPDGSRQLAVGPIFSHYEFKQNMSDRLTDEAWIHRIDTGNIPKRSEWTQSYWNE